MTSDDDNEIIKLLNEIKVTTGNMYYMHESFNADEYLYKFIKTWLIY